MITSKTHWPGIIYCIIAFMQSGIAHTYDVPQDMYASSSATISGKRHPSDDDQENQKKEKNQGKKHNPMFQEITDISS